jgi:hypothetical protein
MKFLQNFAKKRDTEFRIIPRNFCKFLIEARYMIQQSVKNGGKPEKYKLASKIPYP